MVVLGDAGNSKHVVVLLVLVAGSVGGLDVCLGFLFLDIAIASFNTILVPIPPSLFVSDSVFLFLFEFAVIVVVSG